MADEQNLKAALKKIADEHWLMRHSPILLSELPDKLKVAEPSYKDALGGKSLKAFAMGAGEDSGFKLIAHPSQRAKLGLAPSDVDFEFPTEEQTRQTATSPALGNGGGRGESLNLRSPCSHCFEPCARCLPKS